MPNVKHSFRVSSHTINVCGCYGASSILPEKSMISEFQLNSWVATPPFTDATDMTE